MPQKNQTQVGTLSDLLPKGKQKVVGKVEP